MLCRSGTLQIAIKSWLPWLKSIAWLMTFNKTQKRSVCFFVFWGCFSCCRENTHPAGFTLVNGLWTPGLSGDVSVACVCGRIWDGSCLWRRHDLGCVPIGRGRAVPRWSFALLGLEFCDDDSHIVHSDSVVLSCTSVDILQSWSGTQRRHNTLTDKNKSFSLLVSFACK